MIFTQFTTSDLVTVLQGSMGIFTASDALQRTQCTSHRRWVVTCVPTARTVGEYNSMSRVYDYQKDFEPGSGTDSKREISNQSNIWVWVDAVFRQTAIAGNNPILEL